MNEFRLLSITGAVKLEVAASLLSVSTMFSRCVGLAAPPAARVEPLVVPSPLELTISSSSIEAESPGRERGELPIAVAPPDAEGVR